LDKLITDFTTSGKVTKDAICGDAAQLDCAFGDAFAECDKVLSMSSSTGLELPTSVAKWTDFKRKCGPSSSSKGFLSTTAPATEDAKERESQEVDEESPEPLDSKNGTQSKNESMADQSDANQSNVSSTQVGTTGAPPACNKDDPTVSLVMSIAPTCFVKCPALCAAVASQASHMATGAPDAATVRKQVCASQDIFACAVEAAHFADCQAVLSAGSQFGLPQTSAALSRLCGQGANDTNSVENSAMRFGSLAGLSAALVAWMMLQ